MTKLNKWDITHCMGLLNKGRLKRAMESKGLTMKALSLAAGRGETFVRDLLERDNAPRIDSLKDVADILGVTVAYLIDEEAGTSPIVGRVGADTGGEVMYGTGDGWLGETITPPGAGADSVALEVVGFSMGLFVDGALIYYSDLRLAPTDDMLGDVVIVGLTDGRVLLKRLMRGSRPGLFDLESLNGPMLRDQEVVWAADIECIVPPKQARKIKI